MSERSEGSAIGLAEAADRLGVHYQTAYKWVRDGTLPAVQVGRTYRIEEDDVTALAERRAAPAPPPPRRPRIGRAADRMHRALVDGDEVRALSMAKDLADQGVRSTQIAGEIVAPALARIGEDWASGAVSVSVEHRATAIAERALADVMPNPRGRRRGTAVVASLSGDRHGIPSLMAAMALRDDHWNVEHLGADVPADELEGFAADVDADLVVITVLFADDAEPALAHDVAERLRSDGRRVLVGSPGAALAHLQEQARA